MTDRLTLARAFEEGGASRDAAGHIATEIYAAIRANVATTDLHEMEQRLDLRFVDVRFDRIEHALIRMEVRLSIIMVAAGFASTIIAHFWR